ncbi:MAG: argininosuccinate lyase [Anaerolineales bacterium]|nr:argininosuccinate lyase [Chloroflexota bacterium]MBL6981092.1 argininosuccinate lyase [Anaerolineales bacterium]
MTLWNGRFSSQSDPNMFALNASISFDQRMAEQDIRGSLAWVETLTQARLLTQEEGNLISSGLQQIRDELVSEEFDFIPSDEDIHTAVERRLGEIIGPLAGKLHTGRSRNDQVATDFRMWLLDYIPNLENALRDLQIAYIERAENDLMCSLTPALSQGKRGPELPSPAGRRARDEGQYIIMPGYTHLQRAQPILLSHWWLSHFWPLQRDLDRLAALKPRLSVLPLGASALAGTPFPIDRHALTKNLGFDQPSPNSIDAVSDRDFAVEFLFVAALIGAHLSKLAESMVIFTSTEFDFFELDDAYATGSSLMPQKKNPDPFELARGKAGTLLGYLTGLLATLKGLPSTYDKDLQEDKVPVFNAYDTLMALLPVIANALRTLTINPRRMDSAIDASMMATDLADYLVGNGIPFREAHTLTGQVVKTALKKEVSLETLSLSDYQSIHPVFEQSVYEVFDPQVSIARRKAFGGTAPEAVKEQIKICKSMIED